MIRLSICLITLMLATILVGTLIWWIGPQGYDQRFTISVIGGVGVLVITGFCSFIAIELLVHEGHIPK